MLIDSLAAILPQPPDPREMGSFAAWGDVHNRIGEVLPEDYIQFIKRYGTGVIDGWLHVLNPFAANPHLNLLSSAWRFLDALRTIKTEFPDSIPFPLYFEPGGLLPWGNSIDGDIFCWRTAGLC